MKQLTILVCPVNAVGHVNACLGTTSRLVARGHRVIFVVEQAWKDKLVPYGVEEYLYSGQYFAGQNTADTLAKVFGEYGQFGPAPAKEKAINFLKYFESPIFQDLWVHYNEAIVKALERFKPHCIITDQFGLMPAIHHSKVPWINHWSCNPLVYVYDENLPPGCSGLPHDDRSQWADFTAVSKLYIHSKAFNDFIEFKLGYPRYPEDRIYPDTQVLTVYATPEEWNYPALRTRPNCFNLEVFDKNESGKCVNFEKLLPKDFLADTLDGHFSGSWIYVSLGSMGSINIELMKRLLSVLAKTHHKYIVSKGPLHDRYELLRNAWGGQYLPQTELIPKVDLVITHGGNNTTTEVFAQGKPMVLLPLFVDQLDNAQRLDETGYGIKLDPYRFTEEELIGAIDRLLADEPLKAKLKAAAERIQRTDRCSEFADKVEQMLC